MPGFKISIKYPASLILSVFLLLSMMQTGHSQTNLQITSLTATPDNTCSQGAVQLQVQAEGGSGNYNYSWVGNPGTFTSSLQNPVAFPAVSTTYTVVVNDAENESVSGQVYVQVTPNPVADAGSDATICENTGTYFLQGDADNEASVEWTTAGDGTFGNTSSLFTSYSPGEQDRQNGSVQISLHAFATPPCTGFTSDQMTLTIAPKPEASAGDDQEICENDNVSLSGTASSYSEVTWSTVNGEGYFTDIHSLQTTYVPQGDDIGNTVTLRLEAEPQDPCTGIAFDQMNADIALLPEPDAGENDSICVGGTYQLSGSVQNNYNSLLWTTSGDGNFQNPNQTNAVYIPGSNDANNGQVTLTMSVTGEGACNQEMTDAMVLSINNPPEADAGDDATICENSTYELQPTIENSNDFQWTTQGDGTFIAPNSDTAVYDPGEQDIENGQVTLQLTAQALPPCTGSVTDEMTLYFEPLPIVMAGQDAEICDNESYTLEGDTVHASDIYWTTSGDGTFDDSTMIDATYFPGQLDDQNNQVTLTLNATSMSPCTDEVQDEMVLSLIEGPSVDAGDDDIICETGTYMPDDANTENTTSIAWTTAGDGTFQNANSITPEYTPGNQDIQNGEVYLILSGENESCSSALDSTLLTIQHEPFADAGTDTAKCVADGTQPQFQLNGEVENSTYYIWSTGGDGSFSDVNALNPTYSFGPMDIENQEVTLSLTANALSPCPEPDEDQVELSFAYRPSVDAGDDGNICEGDTIPLNATATNVGTLIWQRIPNDGAGGTFDDATNLDAVYSPSQTDYENGEIQLMLQVFGEGQCGELSVNDTVTYTVQQKPVSNAGEDKQICETGTVELSGTAENYGGIQWNAPNGSGTFSEENALVTSYQPSAQDLEKDTIFLVMSAWALLPCQEPVEDTAILTINKNPTVSLGADISACSSEPVELEATADNFSLVQWSSSGDGTFTSTQGLDTEYEIGQEDIDNGQVTITFTAHPRFPCSDTVADQMIITVKEAPSIEMQNMVETQFNTSITFQPTVTGFSDIYSYQWEPADMFVNPTEKNGETIMFPYEEENDSYRFDFTVTDENNNCTTTDTVRMSLALGEPIINLEADPPYVCEGGQTTLRPNVTGGTGSYSYYWTSTPGTFTSNQKNPTVSPEETTTYRVTVNDQNFSPSESIMIEIKPNAVTPQIEGNSTTEEFEQHLYTTNGSDAAYYEWWARNGSVIQGQGSKEVTIEWGRAGIGYVYLQKANEWGCYGDTTEMMVNIGTNDIRELASVENLTIYPNPVRDVLNIRFKLKQKKDVSLALHNSMGSQVFERPAVKKMPGVVEYSIDMKRHESGLYLLQLRVGEESTTKRILRIK